MRKIHSHAKKRSCNSKQILIFLSLALIVSFILSAITVRQLKDESSEINFPSISFNISDDKLKNRDVFAKDYIQVSTRAKDAIPHSSKPIPTIQDESNISGGVQQTLEIENKSLKSSLDNSMISNYTTESSTVVSHGAASMRDSEASRLPTRKYTCNGTSGPMTYPEVPGFIIAGAQKSGTSALRHILASHPDIITNDKLEAHYFDRKKNFSETFTYSPDLRGKLDTIYKPERLCDLGYSYITKNLRFNKTHDLIGRMSFEKTPAYMIHPHLPELISLVCPWKPKIIIILRDPVDRAYSAYDMMRVTKAHPMKKFMKKIMADVNRLKEHGILLKGNNTRNDPNPQWLKHNHTYKPYKMKTNILLKGFYANQIEPWLEHFPLGEKLLVLRYEEFKNNNTAVVGKVLKFLGLPQMNFTAKQLNTNYSPVNTTLIRKSNIAVDFLEAFYSPYNNMLADLLGEEWRNVWDESKKAGGVQNISDIDSDLKNSVFGIDTRSKFVKEDIQVSTRAKDAIPHSSKPMPTIQDESNISGGVQQTLEIENKSLKSSLDNSMISNYTTELSTVVSHGAASMRDSEASRLPTRKYTCNGTSGPITYPEVPGFIIAGAQKSGTSALRHILASHPDIITNDKLEAHYFDRKKNFSETFTYSPDLRGKLDTIYKPERLCDLGYSYITKNLRFNKTHDLIGRMSFEKTPAYMSHPHLPELISLVCPWKPKIIIILRDPVDRAYSAYDMMRTRNNGTRIFMKKIMADVNRLKAHGILLRGNNTRNDPNPQWLKHNHKYKPYKMKANALLRGFYANQIEPWLEHFPLGEKLLVLRYEEFKNNNAAVVGKVLKFLGLPQMNFTAKQLNTNYSPVNTTLIRKSNIAVDFLEAFYSPYNDMLADLLGEEWRNVWERPTISDESKRAGGVQNISDIDSDYKNPS